MARAARRSAVKKVAAVAKFIDIDELDESINILVYGDSGCGKTRLGGSAYTAINPEYPTLFISIESGAISAKRAGTKSKIWPVKTWEDIEEAYNWLFENPDHGFYWVVIDSLTHMQRLAMKSIQEFEYEKNASRDRDRPEIQDYLKLQNMFLRFTEAFCELPVNCYFTALAMTANDPDTGDEFLTPMITGKKYEISQQVCGMMSAYGYMKVLERKNATTQKVTETHRIYWRNRGAIRAKDRYRTLAPFTDDKSLADITHLILDEPAEPKPSTPARRRRTNRKATV